MPAVQVAPPGREPAFFVVNQRTIALRLARKARRARVVGRLVNPASMMCAAALLLWLAQMAMPLFRRGELCAKYVEYTWLLVGVIFSHGTVALVLWKRWWRVAWGDEANIWVATNLVDQLAAALYLTVDVCPIHQRTTALNLRDTRHSVVALQCASDTLHRTAVEQCVLVDQRSRAEANVPIVLLASALLLLCGILLWRPHRSAMMAAFLSTIGVMASVLVIVPYASGEDAITSGDRRGNGHMMTLWMLYTLAGAVASLGLGGVAGMEEQLYSAQGKMELEAAKRTHMPRGNVVLLETDIEGSTSLWETLPETVMRRVIARYFHIARKALPLHYGWEFSTEGDALFLAFHDVVDAVAFGVHFQLALHTTDWPAEIHTHPKAKPEAGLKGFVGIRSRVAIHMGKCESATYTTWGSPNVYSGDPVTVTHILSGAGPGGMIVVSDSVASALSTRVEDLHEALETRVGSAISAHFRAHNSSRAGIDGESQKTFDTFMVSLGWHRLCDESKFAPRKKGAAAPGQGYLAPLERGHRELFSILPWALVGRHEMWDASPPEMGTDSQTSPGFYDAPGKNGEDAAVMFVRVVDFLALRKAEPRAAQAALMLAERYLRKWVNSEGGYAVPRRDGRFFAVFSTAGEAMLAFEKMCNRLPHMRWPSEILHVPGFEELKTPTGTVAFRGFRVGAGLCVGPIQRLLESSGTADFQGPAANRAARLCARSEAGRLLMLNEEALQYVADIARTSFIFPPTGCQQLELKGYGLADVVALERSKMKVNKLDIHSAVSFLSAMDNVNRWIRNLPSKPSSSGTQKSFIEPSRRTSAQGLFRHYVTKAAMKNSRWDDGMIDSVMTIARSKSHDNRSNALKDADLDVGNVPARLALLKSASDVDAEENGEIARLVNDGGALMITHSPADSESDSDQPDDVSSTRGMPSITGLASVSLLRRVFGRHRRSDSQTSGSERYKTDNSMTTKSSMRTTTTLPSSDATSMVDTTPRTIPEDDEGELAAIGYGDDDDNNNSV